jgi:hypothetical protein
VVAVVAAVADADSRKTTSTSHHTMKTLLTCILLAAASLQSSIGAEEKTGPAQRVFVTPLVAADALIAALRAYVAAQRQYAAEPRDGTEVRQFAQKIQSTPGKKDGLYWPVQEGEEPSPAGPAIKDTDTPYAGYHFKILTAQGDAAPAGKYSYVINGRLIAGFAMVAWPADYGKTGVMTLLVNHYGDVYQKDLGQKTATLAAAISDYNPDTSWSEVAE